MFTITTAIFGSITNIRKGVEVNPIPKPTMPKTIEPNNIAGTVIIISRPNIAPLIDRHVHLNPSELQTKQCKHSS